MRKKAFGKATRDSFSWSNIKSIYGQNLLAILGGLLLLRNALNWSVMDSALTVLCVGLLILFSIYLFNWIRYTKALRKEAERKKDHPYGEMIIGLKELFARINGLKTLRPNIDKENFKSVMQYVCDKLREIYEKKTGAECGVSIKMFIFDNDDFGKAPDIRSSLVINLITDKKTASSTTRNGPEYKRIKSHQVIKNTAYKKIVESFYADKTDGLFHVHNSLPTDLTYQSTSFQAYGGDKRKEEMTESEMRSIWPLEYRSEIVVPIFSSFEDSFDKNSSTWAGFLCLDASVEDAFNPIYDVEALIGVSEGIFDLFQCHYQNHVVEKFIPKTIQDAKKSIQKEAITKTTRSKIKKRKK